MWDLVVELADTLAAADDKRLTSADITAVCDALEDAAASWDRAEMKKAGEALEQGFRTLLSTASADVRKAVIGTEGSSAEAAAYTLGQIGFAQAFASRAYERRTDASFADTLVLGRFEKLVRALVERPMNGVELSERIGLSEEAISRNLKELRLLGVTDYRRDGTRTINFLTPPAAALAKTLNMGHLPLPKQRGQDALQALKAALPDHLLQTPVFADQSALERSAA